MARPIRVEFPGAVYHVMARSNERRATFRDDVDRRRFLETLGEMVAQFEVRLGGERQAVVAREFGYANGSSVLYALRRLEQRQEQDRELREKLRRLKE